MGLRYDILAVGKLKRGFYRTGCDHYLQRLGGFANAQVIELKEGRGAHADEIRAAEGELILARTSGRMIALDERGERLRSRDLADRIASWAVQGTSHLTFVIGGAEGLADAVKERADAVWRLSDLTLPHDLARLVLLEQLYRAETIRVGHPYHRE